MKNYYVYLYLNPLKENQPFYVGKGRGNRYREHLTETKEHCCNLHKFHTIQKIRKETECDPPVTFYIKNISNEDASQLEISLIKLYGRQDLKTGILTNKSDGGEGACGVIQSDKKREKLRIANTGKKRSEEAKRNQSITQTGKKRKPHSPETIQKMKDKAKGRRPTKLMNGNLVPLNTGNTLSEQSKELIRNANIGKKQSSETIEKRVSKLRGRKYNK